MTRGEPPFGVRDLTQCRPGLVVFVAARSLGLTLPQSVLLQAGHVVR